MNSPKYCELRTLLEDQEEVSLQSAEDEFILSFINMNQLRQSMQLTEQDAGPPQKPKRSRISLKFIESV